MGRNSFEILFFTRKDTGKKTGKNLIMARISVNGLKPVQVSLKLSVTPKLWDQRTHRAIEKLRDVFIFCCFTGLSYSDAQKATADNLSKEDDGRLWLITYRNKTEVKSTVLLLDIAIKILDKYAEHRKKTGRLLPVISNQKCNEYLKEIADVCEIKKHLKFHTARYTFGTTVTLGNGVPLNHVQRGLGHKKITQTQHYASLLLENLSLSMQQCNEKTQSLQTLYLSDNELFQSCEL